MFFYINKISLELRKKIFLIILLLIYAESGVAQIINPVTWEFNTNKVNADTIEIIFEAKITAPWHMYSQDIPVQPPGTLFYFEPNDDVQFIGNVTEETIPKEEYDPNFDMNLKYFEGVAIFKQSVKLLNAKPVQIKGYIEYMCCDESRCIPPTVENFDFTINQSNSFASEENIPSRSDEIDQSTENRKKPLLGFFLFSFLFGFAAILTPCVFPMIPLTVSFFIKDKNNSGKFQAIIYGVSIICIYVIIGFFLAIFLGPEFANFLSTHWIPNVLFFVIFLIFALSFFGMFEITLPGWMISKSDRQSDRGGILGPIFMALTLVLVSFSCTGPIVGMILVESAGGMVLKPIVGMLGFSIAFAMPFTLFAFFPSWLNKLPKSGGWMNSVKIVLGFIELALGLKFLSIADQTYHWHILDREVYLALWIAIFTLMGFYFLRKIKFVHDDEEYRVTAPRLILAIITFGFVIYMVPGMIGAPLKAISGYIPPQSTQDFDLQDIIRENYQHHGLNTSSEPKPYPLCEEPKYADFLHLPHGLTGYFDYEQALACAKAQNKPLFIDFTGHGCVNCREMEANVWSDPRVLKRLMYDFVVVALYVDDKTKLPESEWTISDYDGKTKKTIGAKFADLQISKFGVNAQPYYVIADPEGNILVEPHSYDLNVENFIDFLDAGKNAFYEILSKK